MDLYFVEQIDEISEEDFQKIIATLEKKDTGVHIHIGKFKNEEVLKNNEVRSK